MTSPVRIHATCLAFGQRGVLLRGPSGSGKSDLALRCITQPIVLADGMPGATGTPILARLVADDQVIVRVAQERLLAQAPANLHGLLEVRGIGVFKLEAAGEIQVCLVVDLLAAGTPARTIERMPADHAKVTIAGIALASLALVAAEPSAPVKLALALARLPPMS